MRTAINILIFLFLNTFCISTLNAQSKIDTLKVIENESPSEKIELLNHLSDSLIKSDPDRSLQYAEFALKLSNEQQDDKGKLAALINIAEIYWSKTDLKNAMYYANQAKELSIDLDYRSEYAETNYIIGKIYTDLGEYDKSSELAFEALNIFEKENNKKGQGKILNSIGYIYYEQENYDKALEYYSQSLEVVREINDSTGIARGLNNVAAVYANKGDFQFFEIYIKEAVEINKRKGAKLQEGINYSNLGQAKIVNNDLDSALYYFDKADVIFTELNNVPKLSDLYLSYSRYYLGQSDFEKSKFYADKAYNLGVDNKIKKSMYNAAKVWHEIYKKENDLENAYKYNLIENQLKDSLDIEQSLIKISQLELSYEFEKIIQEKKLVQQHKDFLKTIYGISVFFILSLIIITLLARQRIKAKNELIQRNKYEFEIDSKNKELTSNVMSLMRKNEVLAEIADKLLEIRNEAVKDETKLAIKRIARELSKSTDQEIWEEFEIRFKQVHTEFYTNLVKKFPKLSPNEERLCAFLRLNMTSKEISELTGQRVATIEMARFRLRKKLGLKSSQTNLVIFLSQI